VGGVGIGGVESSGSVIAILQSEHGTVTHNTEMRDSYKIFSTKNLFLLEYILILHKKHRN